MSLKNNAFTLIELILTIGLFAVLSAIATINLIKPQTSINVTSYIDQISTDIKNQQISAMEGKGHTEQGIYFESDKYVLFEGSTYNASDPDNLDINLATGYTFSNINLTSNQIIFSQGSGDISNYLNGSFVTLSHNSGETKTININKLGALNIQ